MSLGGTIPEAENRAMCEYKIPQMFVSFFAFIMSLKVRMFCIKDYQQVSQERKCRSEAAGYSPWSVSGLLPHLRRELQILALVSCQFWVGVTRSFAEQEAHSVQSSAPQVTCVHFIQLSAEL